MIYACYDDVVYDGYRQSPKFQNQKMMKTTKMILGCVYGHRKMAAGQELGAVVEEVPSPESFEKSSCDEHF